jgi:hypothetical protein
VEKTLFARTNSKSRGFLKIVKMQPVFLVIWGCAKGHNVGASR